MRLLTAFVLVLVALVIGWIVLVEIRSLAEYTVACTLAGGHVRDTTPLAGACLSADGRVIGLWSPWDLDGVLHRP